ncbi:hypothetical protein KFL_000410160 [Klebsormidium nitens]|uniref:DOMON domain-containing protein n=1 Tax=Klebsormidium nitens TaxID=105231 RepID=A0A1Y1HTQ0_KLENI|nr:hypothetical protein KFL_000410160 [Klebsormidium nitens]|eukprot:GAQ79917.1 hypothetical protein KFL_000410160 [Klebsormidium nitens]
MVNKVQSTVPDVDATAITLDSWGHDHVSRYTCAANGTDALGSPSGYTLHWTTVASGGALALAAEAPTGSWVAVGFSRNGMMVGSEAVVGKSAPSPGTPAVQAYSLIAQNPVQPAMSVQVNGNLNIQNATVETPTSGRILLRFQRSFPDGGNVPVQLNGIQQMVWSYGPAGSTFPTYHLQNRGAIAVDFSATPTNQIAPTEGSPSPATAAGPGANLVVPAGSPPLAGPPVGGVLPGTPAPAPGRSPAGCVPSTQPGLTAKLWLVLRLVPTPGWIAIGVSPTGGMIGTDAVVAIPGGQLRSYMLTAHDPSGVNPVAPGFRNGSIDSANGMISMTFTRDLTGPGRVPINTIGGTFIVWSTSAARTPNFPGPEYHGNDKGAVSIDFASGVSGPPISASSLPPRTYYKAHGWMMWVAFGVLFPLGIMTARYGKRWDPYWFWAHVGIQILAVCVATAAGGIALARFKSGPLLHKNVGLSVLILIWIQPVLGLLRPHKGTLLRLPWFFLHWLLGTTAVVLAWINIFWGLDRYRFRFGNTLRVWYVLWAIILSFWAFLYLFLATWPEFKAQLCRPIPKEDRNATDSAQSTTEAPAPANDEASSCRSRSSRGVRAGP